MEDFNFGTRVEELLNQNGVKAADFYRAVEIIPQNFYDWKKKGTVPNARTALKVAKFFGVTVEYLMTGEDIVYENPLKNRVLVLEEKLRKITAYVNKINEVL